MTVQRRLTVFFIIMLLPVLCGSAIKLPELTDIQGHWATEYIVECTNRGICIGYDNGYFMPNEPVTRAEFTKMVMNAFNLFNSEISTDPDITEAELMYPVFEDVENHWSKPYVEAAYTAKIIKGVDEYRFMPDKALSRQDAVLILSRIEEYLGKKLLENVKETEFLDAEYIREDCRVAVSDFQKAGILLGKTGNMFDPIGAMTRAEACKCIILTIIAFETPL